MLARKWPHLWTQRDVWINPSSTVILRAVRQISRSECVWIVDSTGFTISAHAERREGA